MYTVFMSLIWVTLFRMIFSTSIHLHTNFMISFLTVEEFSIVSIHQIFFTYSPIDRHLGCFQTLPIMNKIAMNMFEQVYL